MFKVFGNNNWTTIPTSDSEKVILSDRRSIYNPDKEKIILEVLKKKYEQKCHRNCFIIKITKVIDFSEFVLVNYDNSGNFETFVVYEAEVNQIKVNDIIVGAKVITSGDTSKQAILKKDMITLTTRINNNINLIKGQLVTIKAITPVYVEESEDVYVYGDLIPHIQITPTIFTLIDVDRYKHIIDKFEKEVKSLETKISSYDKKLVDFMKEKLYPFEKDQSNKLKFQKQSFRELIKSKENVEVVANMLLHPIDGLVYYAKTTVEKDSYTSIVVLYEHHIKALMTLKDMCSYYRNYNDKSFKYLWNYYNNAKINNRDLLDKSLILLEERMVKAGMLKTPILPKQFPYSRNFLPDEKTVRTKLKNYEIEVLTDKYRLNYFSKHGLFNTSKYNNKYVRFKNNLKIDCLTDILNEEERVKYKNAKQSPLEVWEEQKKIISYIRLNNIKNLTTKRCRQILYKVNLEPGNFYLTWLKGIFNYLDLYKETIVDINPCWGDVKIFCDTFDIKMSSKGNVCVSQIYQMDINKLKKKIKKIWPQVDYLLLYITDGLNASTNEEYNLFMEQFKDSSFEGVIGLEYKNIHPLWVWKKSTAKKRWNPSVKRPSLIEF